jgi:uncharacterized oxidoreductase
MNTIWGINFRYRDEKWFLFGIINFIRIIRFLQEENPMKKSGNTILITGGSSGIGFALSKQFMKAGNTVIACARNIDLLERAASELPGLVTHRSDLTIEADRTELTDWLLNEFPGLNILINNAGIQNYINFASPPDPKSIIDEIGINLTAPIILTTLFIPHLKLKHDSFIVNISSGLAFAPLAFMPVYCATKAALHSFTMSLRHQLRDLGIRVVEIIPPMVDTALRSEGRRNSSGSTHGSGRHMMSPDEFAEQAVPRFFEGEDEIAVGAAAGLRKDEESRFEMMNR